MSSSNGTPETPSFEPTVLKAVWRYRNVVIATTIAAMVLGAAYAATRPTRYVASASLVVQDPRSSQVFDPEANADPRRYVADQVATLESSAVIREALSVLERDTPYAASFEEFQANVVIVSNDEKNSLIQVSFTDSSPEVATRGANAVVEAYRSVRRSQAAADASTALDRLDDLRRGIDEELATISASLGADPSDGERSALLLRQEALIGRSSELQTLRDQLEVDAERGSSGIAVYSPAVAPPDEATNGGIRLLLLLGIVGSGVGAAIAYVSSVRRRRFGSRYEPELVLDGPLLSDVPVFYDADVELPVLAAPSSAAAESFRFAATSIQIQSEGSHGVVVAVVSPNSGDGKSAVTANIALALAQSGRRTLVIDADSEKQDLRRILSDGLAAEGGLSDVLTGRLPLQDALHPVMNGRGLDLDMLHFGTRADAVAEVLLTGEANHVLDEVFHEAKRLYDFVLIDNPPLPRYSMAARLVARSDAALAVVSHDGLVAGYEEVAERLRFIGTPLVGYVYNRAPLRSHWLTPYVPKEPQKRRLLGAR